MNKTPLIQYVFALTQEEIKQFELWLTAPLFNTRKELVYLFNWILPYKEGRKPINSMNKRAAYQAIFPNKPYNDQQLRHLMSYLLKQLRQFLIWQTLQEKEVEQEIFLLENLRKRGLQKQFNQHLNKTKKLLKKQPSRNHQYHFYDYQIQVEQYEFLHTYSREATMPLREIVEAFSTFSIANLLKWHCTILTHRSVSQELYDTAFLDYILQHIETNKYETTPVIQIYYQIYKALTTKSLVYYEQLKKGVLEYASTFPIEERRDIILLAINFCIKKINDGIPPFLEEAFEWYMKGLEEDVLIINGILSQFSYKNIVVIGLKLEKFEQILNFMKKYKSYIRPEYQHDIYYFNLALWYQFQQQYDEVQSLIQKVTFKDVLHALHAKRILLKIYYETNALKSLNSLLDSIKIYLYRHKKLGYHKDNYLKLIQFTERLIRLNPYDSKGKLNLKKSIEAEQSLLEKKWFLQQLE